MPTKPSWKTMIRRCCEEAGTYQPYSEKVIEQLADVMKRREKAVKQFKEEGEQSTIEYENSKGAVNVVKNPLIQIINDYDTLALAFWRELGITPRALKALGEDAVKKKGKKSISEALAELSKR